MKRNFLKCENLTLSFLSLFLRLPVQLCIMGARSDMSPLPHAGWLLIMCRKSKLYRFDRELGEWKERGVGDAKLLKNKKTGKIRLLMRRERTLKICANHFVNPLTELKEHAGSDKAWVWQTMDYADGEQKDELFTMKFGSVDSAQRFKAEFAKAQEHMKTVLADGGATVDKAADALKELSVKEEPTEGKEEKEEAS
eukprot:jgi/Mesvir1/2026/Mv16550-RA.1